MTEPLYEKLIYENTDKGYQYRLVVSEFHDVQYLHLRKYFQSYDSGFIASKEGASIPLTIQNSYNLLDGLLEILSLSEGEEVFKKYFEKPVNMGEKFPLVEGY